MKGETSKRPVRRSTRVLSISAAGYHVQSYPIDCVTPIGCVSSFATAHVA